MNDRGDGIHDLIGAYALGALDDVERAQFERHLHQCADCQAELVELREATVALDEALAARPPAHIRESVLQQIGDIPQLRPNVREPENHDAASRRRSAPIRRWGARGAKRLALAAAAVVALVVVVVGVNILSPAPDPLDAVRTAAVEGDSSEVNRLLEEFRDDLDVEDVVTGTGISAQLVSDDNNAVLITDGLPGLPAGQTYQAWLVDDEGPQPAGLLGAGADPVGEVGRLHEGVGAVAVSVEPTGGSEQPSDRIVLTIPTA